MGICSKAKEIVYANDISNIKVDSKEKDDNNNEVEKIDNNHSLNGTTQKLEKQEELSQSKKLLIKNENEKEKRKRFRFQNYSGKKVYYNSHELLDNDLNEKDNSNNMKKRERGRSSLCRDQISKFKRSSQKSATLMHTDNNLLMAKLRGIEMRIPVIQETLITQKFGDPDKYYKKIKDLGSGSYGAVYKAKNLIMDNIVAIKAIEKVQDNMIDDLEIKNEIDILKTLSHPNIVKIYEFFDTALYYYLVTEYCKKGELFAYITNVYNERQLSILFYQVFSGLCYLHEKKILHRDLKLENLMISEIEKDVVTGEEYFWIKIIDFGTAKIFHKNKTEKAVIGSSYYIAPEVLKQKYNEKCDTWSVMKDMSSILKK